MEEDGNPPNLTLRVGLAATVGVVAQIVLLAIPANGRPTHILAAFALLPPSVVPTLCVAWTLRRSGVLFPGTHGLPITLSIGSWHFTFILSALLLSIAGTHFDEGAPLVMSTVGTIPIAAAVWRLARFWDWGRAFLMLGAGAAVGAVAAMGSEWATLMLVMTIVWTTTIAALAGSWLTKAAVAEA